MRLKLLIIAIVLFFAPTVNASPRYTQAKQAAEKVKKAQVELRRKMRGLNDNELAKLKANFRGTDSDGDGVANEIESGAGSNVCDADSDDDGLDDNSDDKPGDSDSNDDGKPDGNDGQPFERKGTIESFVEPTLVVAGLDFKIDDNTVFETDKKDKDQFDKSDLKRGLCVEFEGQISAGQRLVKKIKRDDDC